MKTFTKIVATTAVLGISILTLAACASQASPSKSSASPNSSMPQSASKAKKTMTGTFEGRNKEKVSGKATISDGKLQLSDFKTSEGPDLHIYLTMGGDVKKGILDMPISLTEVEQSFTLPDELDSSKYDTVVIWCDKAGVAFGEAKLS